MRPTRVAAPPLITKTGSQQDERRRNLVIPGGSSWEGFKKRIHSLSNQGVNGTPQQPSATGSRGATISTASEISREGVSKDTLMADLRISQSGQPGSRGGLVDR